MKLESQLPKQSFWLYLGPVLNVLTLLLVFFLLGSNFVIQSGIKVTLPETPSRLPGFDRAHVISVGTGGDAAYFFDGEPTTLDAMKQKLTKAKGTSPKVIVHGDTLAPYGRVMEAADIALALGYEVAFATQPPKSATP
jgi:biopolymer transport protein ExbD